MDHVPALKLLFWPLEAQEWIDRDRKWPSADMVQSIVDNGCQIVPRSSPGGDIHSEWRLSFSVPEAELTKLRSKDQQRAYYYFKVLFYRYLKTQLQKKLSHRPTPTLDPISHGKPLELVL